MWLNRTKRDSQNFTHDWEESTSDLDPLHYSIILDFNPDLNRLRLDFIDHLAKAVFCGHWHSCLKRLQRGPIIPVTSHLQDWPWSLVYSSHWTLHRLTTVGEAYEKTAHHSFIDVSIWSVHQLKRRHKGKKVCLEWHTTYVWGEGGVCIFYISLELLNILHLSKMCSILQTMGHCLPKCIAYYNCVIEHGTLFPKSVESCL